MTATMLAVAFPGLGQIYNRKYWKVPFVYAGFGALIYFVGFNSSNYNKYMKAYQDFTDDIKETTSYLDVIPDNIDPSTYDPVWYPTAYDPAIYFKLGGCYDKADRLLQKISGSFVYWHRWMVFDFDS